MSRPAADGDAGPLLSVRDLSVRFRGEAGEVLALDRVSLELRAGETLAVVGESGSGKSVLALALMGLLPPGIAQVSAAGLRLGGRDLLGLPARGLRRLRGREMAMIFQEPDSALHPVRTIGAQIVEAIRLHAELPRAAARARAIEMLRETGVPAPERRVDAYPHELSGGLRQRAMIAMALVLRPRLLIADEPTTALDVTVQAQILELLRRLARDAGTAVLLVTHDLGVVAEMADRVMVLYAGRAVETAPAAALFDSAEHPYMVGLLSSMPSVEGGSGPLTPIEGTVPDLRSPPAGCSFHPRCPFAEAPCAAERPALREIRPGHLTACRLSPLIETLGGRPLGGRPLGGRS